MYSGESTALQIRYSATQFLVILHFVYHMHKVFSFLIKNYKKITSWPVHSYIPTLYVYMDRSFIAAETKFDTVWNPQDSILYHRRIIHCFRIYKRITSSWTMLLLLLILLLPLPLLLASSSVETTDSTLPISSVRSGRSARFRFFEE